MNELLEKKVELAKEKIPVVQNTIERLQNGAVSKAEKLYLSESGKEISLDSGLFDKQVAVFRKSFCIFLKARYLM